MYRIVFTEEGIEVKRELESLMGKKKWITDESFPWGDFPKGSFEMRVTGASCQPSGGGGISKLELEAESVKLVAPPTGDSYSREIEEELGIRIAGDEVELNPEWSAKDNLVAFVGHLLDHDYITDEDLPVSVGYKRYLLNTEPLDKKGNGMLAPVQIRENPPVFLEAHWDAKSTREKIAELSRSFGLRMSERAAEEG